MYVPKPRQLVAAAQLAVGDGLRGVALGEELELFEVRPGRWRRRWRATRSGARRTSARWCRVDLLGENARRQLVGVDPPKMAKTACRGFGVSAVAMR